MCIKETYNTTFLACLIYSFLRTWNSRLYHLHPLLQTYATFNRWKKNLPLCGFYQGGEEITGIYVPTWRPGIKASIPEFPIKWRWLLHARRLNLARHRPWWERLGARGDFRWIESSRDRSLRLSFITAPLDRCHSYDFLYRSGYSLFHGLLARPGQPGSARLLPSNFFSATHVKR
jgi:hypothetical protein